MSEWRELKIGELIKLEYGKGLQNYRTENGIYEVFGTNGKIGLTNSYLYDKPSLVIGRKGAYRGVHLAKNPFFVIDTAFYTKNIIEELSIIFLYYWFKCIDINSMDSGSAIPSTNRDEIYDLDISLPNFTEQKAIAAVLSSLDDKIDLLHRQNKTLEQMAETLFKQWFIVEARDDWEEKPLGDIIETTSGGTPPRSKMEYYENGSIHWVKSKELYGSFILETEEMITKDAIKNSSAKLLPKNSILIAMYGATVGECAIISKEMTCNQAICALKPNNQYPYSFIFMFIKNIKEELINMAVGSAQQNISQLLIKQLSIPTCYERIKEFDNKVLPLFEKMKTNKKQIRTLEKLRDELLPKLMSGEVRVKYT